MVTKMDDRFWPSIDIKQKICIILTKEKSKLGKNQYFSSIVFINKKIILHHNLSYIDLFLINISQ